MNYGENLKIKNSQKRNKFSDPSPGTKMGFSCFFSIQTIKSYNLPGVNFHKIDCEIWHTPQQNWYHRIIIRSTHLTVALSIRSQILAGTSTDEVFQ